MDIVGLLTPLGTVLVIGFLAYKEYRSGSATINDQVLEGYKERNKQLEEKLADERSEKLRLTGEVAAANATLAANAETIRKQEAVIANRNPELVAILGEIRDFMHLLHNKVDLTYKSSNANSEELHKQSEALNISTS
jgi:hypothetical protein